MKVGRVWVKLRVQFFWLNHNSRHFLEYLILCTIVYGALPGLVPASFLNYQWKYTVVVSMAFCEFLGNYDRSIIYIWRKKLFEMLNFRNHRDQRTWNGFIVSSSFLRGGRKRIKYPCLCLKHLSRKRHKKSSNWQITGDLLASQFERFTNKVKNWALNMVVKYIVLYIVKRRWVLILEGSYTKVWSLWRGYINGCISEAANLLLSDYYFDGCDMQDVLSTLLLLLSVWYIHNVSRICRTTMPFLSSMLLYHDSTFEPFLLCFRYMRVKNCLHDRDPNFT